MSAALALQQAVFAALSNDAGVKAQLGTPPRLYDAAPRAAAFPFAVLGDGEERDWSTATDSGSEHRFAVQLWSRKPGHAQNKEIAAAIRAALHDAALAVAGCTLVSLRHLATDFARERDGETWRATLKFRAVLEPNA